MRTEEWRYTEWGFGENGKELYNEIADPKELLNLAGKPEYAGIQAKMKTLLKKVHPSPVTGGKAMANTREKFSN